MVIKLNELFLLGLLMLLSGVILFAVIQFFMFHWLKKYNDEWAEGDD